MGEVMIFKLQLYHHMYIFGLFIKKLLIQLLSYDAAIALETYIKST